MLVFWKILLRCLGRDKDLTIRLSSISFILIGNIPLIYCIWNLLINVERGAYDTYPTKISINVIKRWVKYRFFLGMRHNDARGWEEGEAFTNDILKFRKVIEFESLCIVICFSYIYLITDWKRSFIN